MEKELYNCVVDAQNGNSEAISKIIKKFEPLVNKFTRKLNYDGANSDLIIWLIEVIKTLPIQNKKLKEEKYIVSYIHKSLFHKYIELNKEKQKLYNTEVQFNEEIAGTESNTKIEDSMAIQKSLDKLPEKQKLVLIKKFYQGYKDCEIANELNVSNSAICKIKKRVLRNLKDLIVV